MSYYHSYKEGQLVLPQAILEHFSQLFQSSDDFLIWLYLLENKEQAPSQIAQKTGKSLSEVNQSITALQKSKALKLTFSSNNMDAIFDVSSLFEHLDQLTGNAGEVAENDVAQSQTAELIQAFEAEMGTIGPTAYEEIQKMLFEDKYDPELIKLALKEAALNRKVNLKYIQAILRNWRRDNITAATANPQAPQAKAEPASDFYIPLD